MEIKVPEVGESVVEALCEIETDKITLEINAEASGVLRIKVPAGTTVKIGSAIGSIEEGEAPKEKGEPKEKPAAEEKQESKDKPVPGEKEAAPSAVSRTVPERHL